MRPAASVALAALVLMAAACGPAPETPRQRPLPVGTVPPTVTIHELPDVPQATDVDRWSLSESLPDFEPSLTPEQWKRLAIARAESSS